MKNIKGFHGDETMTKYEIIDFHTHPFDDGNTNLCAYQADLKMSAEKELILAGNAKRLLGIR